MDVTAHTLRDTAATRWLRAGAGADVVVVVVAGLLGHASLDATRTYTLPTDRELAAAVEAAAVEARAVELADEAGALVAQARRRAARRRRLDLPSPFRSVPPPVVPTPRRSLARPLPLVLLTAPEGAVALPGPRCWRGSPLSAGNVDVPVP